jgi:hypothetical protein
MLGSARDAKELPPPGLSDEETLVKCPIEDMARKCYLIISKTTSSTLALVGVTVAVKFTEVEPYWNNSGTEDNIE